MAFSFTMRPFEAADRSAIQQIRAKAFKPIFASFRKIVGKEIAHLQFRTANAKQANYLDLICASNSGTEVYVLLKDGAPIGFLGLSLDEKTSTGEISLNAVDPNCQGKGAGQFMYAFAINHFREKGMKASKVSTGGDDSHLPTRKAYEKAGFKVGIPSVTLFQVIPPVTVNATNSVSPS